MLALAVTVAVVAPYNAELFRKHFPHHGSDMNTQLCGFSILYPAPRAMMIISTANIFHRYSHIKLIYCI